MINQIYGIQVINLLINGMFQQIWLKIGMYLNMELHSIL